MKIGSNIRKIRMSLGIKQEELAFALNVSQSYLSKIETNRSKIYVDDLLKIAAYTNKPVGVFFSEQVSETRRPEISKQREEIIGLLREQHRCLQLLLEQETACGKNS